jgi:hypothetical protein
MMVGKYSYPTYRVGALLKDVRILYDKFENKYISTEHISQLLGHKPKSGGFNQKLADLKSYGLIVGSRGSYRVSDIGIKATYPGNPGESEAALDKAVRRIDLWRIIYEKCGKVPEEHTFWIDLAEITDVSRPESQKKADTVRKAYMEDAKYILSVEKPVTPLEVPRMETRAPELIDRMPNMETVSAEAPSIGGFDIIQFSLGESRVVIKDMKSLRIIKKFLDNLCASLENEKGDE